ncbi:hypothetical protein SAMN06265338_102471 [Rhodoblastus acidophilus]|uniref:Uncharacterized protein n=1 Tax=Rhodoblastus acidophilus TaxID=1074 RepID=A0A212R3D5_RHOAC|nr:hypothetical protein [Rhodoblastus acidophilus]PPQ40256.1 hypothetical protein CKO16_00365 [Rhodoblastus acidophilus]RAI19351.1 hypothetical protein CH337_12300 [Rhodoblastus acidophilus]SNB66539.1 hypothetical protein SAMN06265338_102471 [Rhodoblastus acidophilus]
MVEQLVAFALGFSICGLIGLAFLPLVSARARRLTLKSIEERLPMTFDEIEADRDLLRARFAVEKRDLEIAVERERRSRAGEAAELGRRTAALVQAEERIRAAETELAARDALLTQALQHGESLRTELAETGARLATREQELMAKTGQIDTLTEAHRALKAELESFRAQLQQAEARNHAFDARRERLIAKIKAEGKRVEQAEAEIKALRDLSDQPGGVAIAELRSAILDLGRQVVAQDQARQDQAVQDQQAQDQVDPNQACPTQP